MSYGRTLKLLAIASTLYLGLVNAQLSQSIEANIKSLEAEKTALEKKLIDAQSNLKTAQNEPILKFVKAFWWKHGDSWVCGEPTWSNIQRGFGRHFMGIAGDAKDIKNPEIKSDSKFITGNPSQITIRAAYDADWAGGPEADPAPGKTKYLIVQYKEYGDDGIRSTQEMTGEGGLKEGSAMTISASDKAKNAYAANVAKFQAVVDNLNNSIANIKTKLSALKATKSGMSVTSANQKISVELNPPAGFMAEPGIFKTISVGSRNGEVEAWALDTNGIPYRYNPFAGEPFDMPSLDDKAENPWVKKDLNPEIKALIDISVSSYGDMMAIAKKGPRTMLVKYDWEKKSWTELPTSNEAEIKLESISVANSENIYAVTEDDHIYKYITASKDGKTAAIWEKISSGVAVATGVTTDKKVIVIGLSNNGKAYELVNKKWVVLKDASNDLVEVTIGNEHNIFGIDKNGLLYKLDYKTKEWDNVSGKNDKQASGFSSISANAAGTIFALDADGENYHKGDDGVKVAPVVIPAVTKAGTPVVVAGAKATATTAVATPARQTRAQAVAAGTTKAKVTKTKTVAAATGKKVKTAKTPKVKKVKGKVKTTTAATQTVTPATPATTATTPAVTTATPAA